MEKLGLPLMLLTIVGGAAAAVVMACAVWTGRYVLARRVVSAGVIWLCAYAAILLSVSFSSEEKVLPLKNRKAFCGFYLDCHMGVAVVGAEKLEAITSATGTLRPSGVFYRIDLEVSSDARAVPLRLDNPVALLVDARNRAYSRVPEAEEALGVGGLERIVAAGESFRTSIVFDVPADALRPRLHFTNGHPLERLVELFLIGDEDSILHKKTLLTPGLQ